ncbi:polymorphic toxin-type HINT domain-containing protein [Kordiimonas sp.]|uniref:polymorphic toxin-type HINT domain-containing protein n=1 Tax=Kordiimonas sp. TaxID=1970157 RepID=UPI003A8FE3D4
MFDPEDPIKRVAECASEVLPTSCGCPGGAVGAGISFPTGTEVLTPEGKIAIKALREGDLVIARHEGTGELGEYLVSALMARQAPGVLWLTLQAGDGNTFKRGITAEHPLFLVGEGWVHAGALKPGDRIRSHDKGALLVLDSSEGSEALKVYNLEIAGAKTYFVGDLEVWSHNSVWGKIKKGFAGCVTAASMIMATMGIPDAKPGGRQAADPRFVSPPREELYDSQCDGDDKKKKEMSWI